MKRPGRGYPGQGYKYERARMALATIIADMRILSGDAVGPSDVSWQDVAGTCACNLRLLAGMLDSARAGVVINGPVVFPSPEDLLGDADGDK